jgi:hypothetical protein
MIEDFIHLPLVSTTPVVHFCEWSKKFETALMVHSGAWGKLIHKKTRSRKSPDTIPLNVYNSGSGST